MSTLRLHSIFHVINILAQRETGYKYLKQRKSKKLGSKKRNRTEQRKEKDNEEEIVGHAGRALVKTRDQWRPQGHSFQKVESLIAYQDIMMRKRQAFERNRHIRQADMHIRQADMQQRNREDKLI